MGWVEVLIAIIGAITGAVGGFVGAKVSLARNKREEAEAEDSHDRSELDLLTQQYDKVLELKKQAREELERQLGTERDENRRLESIIRDQNARIDRLEAQVRDLVSSALAAGACAAAPGCPTHVPIISLTEGRS